MTPNLLPNGAYFRKGDSCYITYVDQSTGKTKLVYGIVLKDQPPTERVIHVKMDDRTHPEYISETILYKVSIASDYTDSPTAG